MFFDETIHPNGKRLFSARILPTKGPWLEFSLDINDILYVHIDRRRKMPVSLLLRAMGFSRNGEVLALFRDEEEVEIADELLGRTLGSEDIVNKRTGEIIADLEIPGTQTSLPMTYMHEDEQYVVFTVGGGGQPAQLIAMTLP